MIRSFRCILTCVFIAGTCIQLYGCEGQMPQLSGTLGQKIDQAIGMGQQVGSVVAQRPSLTEADEERIAQENAQKFEQSHKLWTDPVLNAYVADIVHHIVNVAHPRPFTYTVKVVDEASVNAFTFGGGLLYVHAGLLSRMDSEGQLAMVLAHEIAHVTESHVKSGIEGAYYIQVAGQLASQTAATSGRIPLSPQTFQLGYDYSMKAALNGHTRSNESEADVIGLEYLVKAGYDPKEAPKTFEQLLKEYGDKSAVENFFYGNHPTSQARIEKLTGLIRSQYSQEANDPKRIANTDEFKRRTRDLVIETGRLDYDRKRFKTAAAMFDKALQIRPDDPIPHYWLGKIGLDTGDTDQAVFHLAVATQGKEIPVEAYRDLGLAYYNKRDSPKAVKAFEQYLKLAPNASDAGQIKKFVDDMKRP